MWYVYLLALPTVCSYMYGWGVCVIVVAMGGEVGGSVIVASLFVNEYDHYISEAWSHCCSVMPYQIHT